MATLKRPVEIPILSVDFGAFSVPSFRHTEIGVTVLDYLGLTWKAWEAPWDYFHKEVAGAWVAWLLIAGHAGAALHHHFTLRDAALQSMLPRRWSRNVL